MDKFSLPLDYRKYYHSLEPMLVKPKTKQYSTVIFFMLTVALFGWYAIRPTIQTILALRREIVDKKALNIQMDEKINALVEAQSILEHVRPQLPVIGKSIPSNPGAVDIARQLTTLGQEVQASVSALQMGSTAILLTATGSALPSSIVKHTTIPLTLSLEGPFPTLSSFMKGLLAMQRIITIDSISFSPNKSGVPQAGINGIRLQLKLNAFYQNN